MKRLSIILAMIFAFIAVTSLQSAAKDHKSYGHKRYDHKNYDHKIYGCVKQKGEFRIVSAPGKCKHKETLVYWDMADSKVSGGEQVPPEQPAPANGGSVKVYDANDQFLGILLNNGASVEVFIPGLNLDTLIDTATGEIATGYTTYENLHCTGEPMISIYSSGNRLWRMLTNSDEIYMAGTGIPVQKEGRSVFYGSSNTCQNSSWETTFFPESISIPKEDIPFTLPVALPLKFRYQ
jgi:hypothetical protein